MAPIWAPTLRQEEYRSYEVTVFKKKFQSHYPVPRLNSLKVTKEATITKVAQKLSEKALELLRQQEFETEYFAAAEESRTIAADFEETIADGVSDETW